MISYDSGVSSDLQAIDDEDDDLLVYGDDDRRELWEDWDDDDFFDDHEDCEDCRDRAKQLMLQNSLPPQVTAGMMRSGIVNIWSHLSASYRGFERSCGAARGK